MSVGSSQIEGRGQVGLGLSDAPGRPVVAGMSRWWMLGVLFLFYCYSYVDRQLLSLLLPDIKRSTGLSDAALGLAYGPAATIVFAVATILAGWAADRYARRLLLMVGMILFGIGTLSFGLAHEFLWFVVARMLVAMGEASIAPTSWSLLSDGFPRTRIATAISIFGMGSKAGNTLALGLGGAIVVAIGGSNLVHRFDQFAAWQIAFVIISLGYLLTAPLAWSFPEPVRRGNTETKPEIGELLRYISENRHVLGLVTLGFALITFCGFSFNTWVPTYLTRHFGMRPIVFGPILAAFGMATSVGLGIKGLLIDWFYSRGSRDIYVRLYTWLMIACLPIFATMFVVSSGPLFLLMYGVVMMVTVPLVSYAATVYAVIVPARLRAQVSALGLVVFALMGGLGAAFTGFLTDHVFHDERMLGYSLATVVLVSVPASLVSLRLSLKPLRAAVLIAEARDAKPCGEAHPATHGVLEVPKAQPSTT